MMDHQCIATVLDGGSTESGRPYFVMELVDGTPIGEYCDACRYTTRQRLELFVQVCQAIQHAHLKGIIHRDIKPSNILVTTYDTVAVPKVIDFGIAKAVHQQLTDGSVYTQISQMVGTPLYMSPEQAQRTGQDVDTRTDVYSLGVLLYELLTGATPFDKERFQESGLDEVKRIIREEEPPKPSTRLSTLGETGIALDTIAETHHTDLRTLTRELSGELDWIVMKALEKDRNRRYESASDFGKDVQRYLDDEPVEACPPSTAYRLGKFYRRNKVAFAFVGTLALTLLIGAGIATGQAIRATKAEGEAKEQKELAEERLTQADEQRQRAEANFHLAMEALDEVYLKAIGEEKLLRDKTRDGKMMPHDQPEFSELERELLQKGLAFYDQFAQQNGNNPEVLFETAKAFYRVALLQSGLIETESAQGAMEPTHGAHAKASSPDAIQEAYTEAISRLKRLTEQHPTEAEYFVELGKAYYGRGQLSRWWPSVSETFAEAKAALDRAVELAPACVEAYRFRSKVHESLGDGANMVADLKMLTRLDPDDDATHARLASILSFRFRDPAGAMRHGLEAVRLDPKNHDSHSGLAAAYSVSGDKEAARVEYERAIELAPSPLDAYYLRMLIAYREKNHPQVIENAGKYLELGERGWVRVRRAEAYRVLGQFDEALADINRAAERLPNNKSIYDIRGQLHSQMGEHEKALADFGKAIELDPESPRIYDARAEIHREQERLEEALADWTASIQRAPTRGHIFKRRGWLYFELGRYDEALADIAKAVELKPEDLSTLSWISLSQVAKCPDERFCTGLLELADKSIELNGKAARAYAARGWILAAFGQEEKALADLKTAFDGIPNDYESGRLGLSETCYELGNLCGELAHREEMLPYLARMTELQPKQPIGWYRCALAQLGASQADAYKATCLAMVNGFQDATSPADGYWVAWTCLLAPEAVDDYAPVVRLAEQAVEAKPESDGYLKTLGGILYRAGRFEEAVERLSEANALIEDVDTASLSSPAYTWYFLAMVHHKLDNDEEAETWLQKANVWTDKVVAEHEEGTATLPWNRQLTLKLLREEAEGMLGKDEE
jgi:tetratricopeptide (TPR) repeat protein